MGNGQLHKCKIFVLLKEEEERRGLQDELRPQCADLFSYFQEYHGSNADKHRRGVPRSLFVSDSAGG